MKKIFNLMTLLLLVVVMVVSCGKGNQEAVAENASTKPIIYTSFYPLESITKEIVGDKIEVRNLIPLGQGVHDWEPSAKDVAELQSSNLLIINGLELEEWVDKFEDSLKTLNILDSSTGVDLLKAEEEHEEADHHDDDKEEGHHHHHGDFDPHIWLSLRNMKVIAKNIYDGVVALDKENEAFYKENLDKVLEKLDTLDKEFTEKLQNPKTKYVITSHDAFSYLFRDYGLEQISIEGLNSESEPDLKTMKEIVVKAKEEGLKYVFYEELSDQKIEETIANEIGGQVKALNTIEGQTEEQAKQNRDYFELMKENLESLVLATQ